MRWCERPLSKQLFLFPFFWNVGRLDLCVGIVSDLYEYYFMLLPRWMEYDYPTMDCQIDCPSLVSHHPMALDQNVAGLC